MKNKMTGPQIQIFSPARNGGFTLMEILFVLLVIALIISFAVPAFRSVRFDVKNARAQAAVKKLAEARRSFYQYSKGSDIAVGTFTGDSAKGLASQTCTENVSSGIPGARNAASGVAQLFACGFLNWKDFAGLPYVFSICPATPATLPCVVPDTNLTYVGSAAYAGAVSSGSGAAGSKYTTLDNGNTYYIYVGPDMQVKDNLE